MGRATFRCQTALHKRGIIGKATLITGIALSFSRSYRIALPSPMNKLDEIIAYHEENGVAIANPHVWTLEDGSPDKTVPQEQSAFKLHADPCGLLNPGKMRSFQPAAD